MFCMQKIIISFFAFLKSFSVSISHSSKNVKAGINWPISETPIKWCFAGGLIVVQDCMPAWIRWPITHLYITREAIELSSYEPNRQGFSPQSIKLVRSYLEAF